jgi:hypothetical protein
MPFGPDQRIAILGDPLFRVVGDEVFILMPDSRMHWLKNPTARYVWESLHASGGRGKSAAELARELSQAFEVTEEEALTDVLAFAAELAERRLVGPAPRV